MSEGKKKMLVPRLRFPEFRDAGEWEVSTIGKKCEILNNLRCPITSSDREKGDYPYYGASGIVDYVKDYIFDERLLLIGEDGAKWGAFEKTAFLAEGKYWVNNHAHVLRTKGVSAVFLENYLVMLDINPFITGAAPPKLTLQSLKSIPIPVVKKPKEQQKIADCLSSIDALITAYSQKLEALKVHKKGIMQQLFPREGETVPCLRFPEFRDAGEWEEKPLGQLGRIITGKTPSTKNPKLWNGNILFITPTDISDDDKYQKSTLRTIKKTKDIKILPAGSIVYTCIASIGKMAITTCPSTTNQQINSIVVGDNTDSEFLYYALANLTPWIKSIPASSTLPIINKTEFSGFIVRIPQEKAEQQKIADCLSSIDALITAHSQKLEALKAHKKGLMQQLFPSPDDGAIDAEGSSTQDAKAKVGA